MIGVSGLGKKSRGELAEILRRSKGTISAQQVVEFLGLPADKAAKRLARWASKGWLSRIRQGLYVPVPLESSTADVPLDDPWIIAERLFSPCYISGWSAAEYWGLTEQIFRTIVVLTLRKPRDRRPKIRDVEFLVRTISEKAFFGTTPVWRERVKMNVADPSRMMVDMLADPALGGGLRPTVDVLRSYFGSEKRNDKLLIEYGDRLGNGAVFKRLGFLSQRLLPDDKELTAACRSRLTKGNAKLDPALSDDRLVSAWRLWVPAGWLEVR